MDRSRSHTFSKKEEKSIAQQPSHRQYSRQFKIDAIELSLKNNKTTKEIADDLGISPNMLYRWKCQYQSSKEAAFPGTGNLKDAQEEEIRQLERKLRLVTEEREIQIRHGAQTSVRRPDDVPGYSTF